MLFVSNLIILGVVIKRSFEENSWMFRQSGGSDKWLIHFLVESCYKFWLAGCLKKIKVLIGKYFFRFFKKNLSVEIFSFWVDYPRNVPLIVNVWFLTSSIVLMPIYNVFRPFTGLISYIQISHKMRVSFERY